MTARSFARGAGATLLLLAAGCGGGNSSTAPTPSPPSPPAPSPPMLGTVTVLGTGCAPGAPAGATCRTLRVEIAGLPPLDVDLRIEEPTGTPLLGTVVVGSGGGGIELYTSQAGGAVVVQELRAAGFRVVDRRWHSGWFSSSINILDQSARYATLLTWIHDQIHTSGVFAATGNSGGSAEIAYALTAWQRGDILDVAVLSSGPPITRLDYVAVSAPPAAWLAQCATLAATVQLTCGASRCTLEPMNPLSPLLGSLPPPSVLHAQSILYPGAQLSFPSTALRVLLGSEDCTSAVPMALLFATSITSGVVVEVVSGGQHWLPTTAPGRAALVGALRDGAGSAGAAITLHAQAPPGTGVLELQLNGLGGAPYLVLAGAVPPAAGADGHLPGLGAEAQTIAQGILDPRGRAHLVLDLPAAASACGSLWLQAVAGREPRTSATIKVLLP